MSRTACNTRTRRSLAVALVGLAVITGGVTPLLAQQARGGADDPILIPDIVVTATRVPISRGRLPTPVTILSGERIRELGIRTVAEALKLVPGLAVVSSGSAGSQTSVFIRGGESDYVKVLVDGAPLNEAGGAIDLADLSTDQVERIEVVRGPASVLYGSDAVSGVVQIFTLRGRGVQRLEVTALGGVGERRLAEGGTHGVMEAEATLSGSGESLSYTVGGGRSWSGGTYALNNENELNTGSLRLAWDGGGPTSLGLTTRFSDGEFHYPTDGAGNVVDENQAVDRRSWATSLAARRRLTNRMDLAFQASTTARDQDSRDEQDGPNDTSGVFASRYQSKVQRNSADLQLTTVLEQGTITIGGSHERATGDLVYDSESEFGPFGANADFERSNTAAYLEVLAEPTDRTQATLGFRTDRNETFGRFNTYRIGFSWNVLEETRIRAATGRAFREPTFGENFGLGFGDLGNRDLVPERTRSWELGLERAVGPLLLSSTWFNQTFADLIQYTFATSGPADPNYKNVGGARSSGLELSAEGTFGPVSVEGSYTYLDTEVVDPGLATDATFVQGEPLLRRPKRSASITGQVVRARGTVSAVLSLAGKREDVDFAAGFPAPRVTLPGYRTLDLSAAYRLPFAHGAATQLRLKVENLLDTDYEGIAGFPAPGRIIRIGTTVQLGG